MYLNVDFTRRQDYIMITGTVTFTGNRQQFNDYFPGQTKLLLKSVLSQMPKCDPVYNDDSSIFLITPKWQCYERFSIWKLNRTTHYLQVTNEFHIKYLTLWCDNDKKTLSGQTVRVCVHPVPMARRSGGLRMGIQDTKVLLNHGEEAE